MMNNNEEYLDKLVGNYSKMMLLRAILSGNTFATAKGECLCCKG